MVRWFRRGGMCYEGRQASVRVRGWLACVGFFLLACRQVLLYGFRQRGEFGELGRMPPAQLGCGLRNAFYARVGVTVIHLRER